EVVLLRRKSEVIQSRCDGSEREDELPPRKGCSDAMVSSASEGEVRCRMPPIEVHHVRVFELPLIPVRSAKTHMNNRALGDFHSMQLDVARCCSRQALCGRFQS